MFTGAAGSHLILLRQQGSEFISLFFYIQSLTKVTPHKSLLCVFLIAQVQSEILKKWRRWKLGRDIEEEYRHTYSQSLQIQKSGSIMVHPTNLPRLPDIATTTSRLGSPEEKQMLVSSSQNGMGTGQGCLQFTSTPQDGSTCSSITEDIVVVDRERYCSVAQGNAESNLWAERDFIRLTRRQTTLASSGWGLQTLGPSWSERCVYVCVSLALERVCSTGNSWWAPVLHITRCSADTVPGSAVSRRWTC